MEGEPKPKLALEAYISQVPPSPPLRLSDLLLRVAVLALTVPAVAIMGMARDTKAMQVQVVPGLPALHVTVLAKFTYSSAFIYFVVANAIASAYTMLSILLSLASKHATTKRRLALAMTTADVMMVALLYSGSGAAAAIGVVGENGNSHTGWNRICGIFSRFCAFVMASIAMSLAASILYVVIVILSVFNLHKRSQ